MVNDFSGSIPIFHGRTADVWGYDNAARIPKYGALISVDSDFKAAIEEEGAEEGNDDSSPAFGIERRKTQTKSRMSSLLGMGYQYDSEKDIFFKICSEKERKEKSSFTEGSKETIET
jgi:hypothetical protein